MKDRREGSFELRLRLNHFDLWLPQSRDHMRRLYETAAKKSGSCPDQFLTDPAANFHLLGMLADWPGEFSDGIFLRAILGSPDRGGEGAREELRSIVRRLP